MMKRIFSYFQIKALLQLTIVTAVLLSMGMQAMAQTAAGTVISNVASATYTDGSSNNYTATSNQVDVTVAKVAGLEITPDGATNATVVAGQTGVTMDFTVKNVGNFTDTVKFLANGASFTLPTGLTVTGIKIDPAGANTTMPLTGGSDVNYSLAQGASVVVRLTVSVASTVATGTSLQVFLGDAASGTNFDNIATDGSAHEVATTTTAAVNGTREARGDIKVVVDNDAQVRVNLTAPAGPVSLGGTIKYTTTVCNDGQRDLVPFDLDGTGTAAGSAIWTVFEIPAGTKLKTSTVPAGTVYSTTALSTAALSATWTATAPTDVTTITRVAYPSSTANLTPGSCTTAQEVEVIVTTNNANTPISATAEGFGNNSIGTTIKDKSGDMTPNSGTGVPTTTTLQKTAGVLIGPASTPAATGPTDNNDDYTNKSFTTGISVAPGGVTTAGDTVIFTNTIQNTGNADDTYTITAPTVPTGWTVLISTDGGTTWVAPSTNPTIAIAFAATADIKVKVTAPAGESVLTGYDSIIEVKSAIDTAITNKTIDRVYTGFVKMNKTAVVDNQTGVGAATDPVPGAKIKYAIAYENISSSGGTGSIGLTASDLVITDDGSLAPTNWATYADYILGSATDPNTNATITGNTTGSTLLKDTITTLAPGATGTFSFNVKIK